MTKQAVFIYNNLKINYILDLRKLTEVYLSPAEKLM